MKFFIKLYTKKYLATTTKSISDENKKAFNTFCVDKILFWDSASLASALMKWINQFRADQIIFSGIHKYGKKVVYGL